MAKISKNISLETWVNDLLAQGKHAFALNALRKEFEFLSEVAIKLSLKRLVDKGLIISVHKGYYLIIPPQYKSKGILPPALYLDAFMKELNRPYYLGLLNAAAYHGAAHQRAQEFFVVTSFPVLRPTLKKGLKVNYISKNNLLTNLIEIRKTEAGYLNISNSILTAIDLIQYAKRVGGMNRVATILNELMENIKPESIRSLPIKEIPITALQRLGYLLEMVLHNQNLANELYTLLQTNHEVLFRTPLKPSSSIKGFETDEKWKVIINTTIEIDE